MARRKGGSRRPPGGYEVGYGKPPITTRFQKGRSGNPKGRPKESKNFKKLLREVLDSKIMVRDAAGTRAVTVREALIRNQVNLALKGDPRTFATIFKLAESEEHAFEQGERTEPQAIDDDDEALIQAFLARRAPPEGGERS